ncbi:EF hand family protein [Trichomonas vaginalis G3]|uniref:EF hand family protein n=1 Tax=Trichomonas vaginalis (strain ATCC PRA-98 / G3) TaxID=412133 RepID=A2FWB0_TRIV3|nr:EF-hand family [Trichomonas vaginalis G3]EAX90812.1 EF hand family protein [Trichomonas vaginalis G3]KAI5548780.1 EF-hand family [Trichomonas vaginalis G3]|eukprot:XP_001303742.1 EF hand family protein [Trichomonas vaginalis G3]
MGKYDENIKILFKIIDDDNSGHLDYDEVEKFFKEIGFDEKYSYFFSRLFVGVIGGRDEKISQTEMLFAFRKAEEWNPKYLHMNCINAIFDTLDRKTTGFIAVEELRRIFNSLGDRMDANQLNGILKSFDDDHNGKLDRDEFTKLVDEICKTN